MKRTSLKEVPFQEESKNEESSNKGQEGCQEEEVQPSQPLLRGWKYASSHPMNLIIGEASKGVSIRSKVHNLCEYFVFISHREPRNIQEAEVDSYWLLSMQDELNQFEHNQV